MSVTEVIALYKEFVSTMILGQIIDPKNVSFRKVAPLWLPTPYQVVSLPIKGGCGTVSCCQVVMGILPWAGRLVFAARQLWGSLQQHAASPSGKSALHIIPTGQHRHFSPGSVCFGDPEAAVLLLWRGKQADDWKSMWQQIHNTKINQETAQQKHDRRKIPWLLFFLSFFLDSQVLTIPLMPSKYGGKM